MIHIESYFISNGKDRHGENIPIEKHLETKKELEQFRIELEKENNVKKDEHGKKDKYIYFIYIEKL